MSHLREYASEFKCHENLVIFRANYYRLDVETFCFIEVMGRKTNKMLHAGVITLDKWLQYHIELSKLLNLDFEGIRH